MAGSKVVGVAASLKNTGSFTRSMKVPSTFSPAAITIDCFGEILRVEEIGSALQRQRAAHGNSTGSEVLHPKRNRLPKTPGLG